MGHKLSYECFFLNKLLKTWNELHKRSEAANQSFFLSWCVCVRVTMIKAPLPHHVLIQPRPDRAT